MTDPMRRRRRAVAMLACLGSLCTVFAACQSTARTDLAGLAELPPLDYAVLVTGGAFTERGADTDAGADPLAATFRSAGSVEAVPLADIVAALRDARVFARIELDGASDDAQRAQFAAIRGHLPLQDRSLRELLDRARAQGDDYLLVVQRLVDGPVEDYGINDRWPVTLSLWLVVGLGMLIPDHTYESRASLHVAVHEIQTGRQVYRTAESGGPVELSLINRASGWGILSSVLIPPFWVGSSADRVVDQVRGAATQRILFSLARQLKSVACQQELRDRSPARIALVRDGAAWRVDVTCGDSLSAVRVRVDGRVVDEGSFDRFERDLLDSEQELDGDFRYRGELDLTGGRFVQVLVQTVAGQVSSSTFDLEAR